MVEYPMIHPPYAQNRAKELLLKYKVDDIKHILESKKLTSDCNETKEIVSTSLEDLKEISNFYSHLNNNK